jgi:hypothetical protein
MQASREENSDGVDGRRKGKEQGLVGSAQIHGWTHACTHTCTRTDPHQTTVCCPVYL